MNISQKHEDRSMGKMNQNKSGVCTDERRRDIIFVHEEPAGGGGEIQISASGTATVNQLQTVCLHYTMCVPE
jgi:hypothetical protein